MKLVILLSLGVAPLRADARLGDGSHADDHLESTRRLQACGTPSGGECERDYQLDLVKKSAAEHEVFDPILRQDNARERTSGWQSSSRARSALVSFVFGMEVTSH